jgi:hypothetical protein
MALTMAEVRRSLKRLDVGGLVGSLVANSCQGQGQGSSVGGRGV